MKFFIKRENESTPVKGRELDLTTPEQRALFGELNPVPVRFLQLVGKRYPLKVVHKLVKRKKKKGEREENKNYSLQTEPTWEHKALFGTDSILCARCKSILWEAPEKGAYQPEERL